MATADFDPCLVDLCRQLDYKGGHVNPGPDDDGNSFEGECTLSLQSFPLSEYTKEELRFLSSSLGTARVGRLEIEGVDDLDWEAILNNEYSSINELQVTVRSTRALAFLVKSLSRNNSLSSLELDYYHQEEGMQGHFGDNDFDDSEDENDNPPENTLSTEIAPSYFATNEYFFRALMPLHHVVLRGITPMKPSSSAAFNDEDLTSMACSWEHLTLEDCDLRGEDTIWMASCITNLQEITINNCQLSEATIQILAEAYLTAAAPRIGSCRKSNGRYKTKKIRRKNALQVLDLSNNDWLLPSSDDAFVLDNVENFDDPNLHRDRRMVLPSPSCMAFLASWLDSLSNLVELNLSYNPQLFCKGMFEHSNRGMVDFCGTVNQSLKRLSLRHCHLIPSDLHHLVNTFCWLEALDLSENPELSDNLLPLSQLEHLTELVLENMFECSSNDTFQFERLLCDEDFDFGTMGQGFTDLLFELLNGELESPSFGAFDGSSRIREFRRHRRKPLERLNLSGNILNRNTLRVLSMFESLKVLILMGCQINSDGMVDLLSGTNIDCQSYSSLTELYLPSNTIGDVGVLALARSLKEQHLSRLKVLDIGSNAISVDAFRVFVEDGVVHSKHLESVGVSDAGVITQNQRQTWSRLEQIMEHNLLLNQAGRFTLYMDSNVIRDEREEDQFCTGRPQITFESNDEGKKHKHATSSMGISNHLWPFILEDADLIYGPDALFYFLHKRPDLIFSSNQPPDGSSIKKKDHDDSATPLRSTSTQMRKSPKSIVDIAAHL